MSRQEDQNKTFKTIYGKGMSNVKLIGICGPARAGKDTFAGNMTSVIMDTMNSDYSDYVIAQESFASPIKSMVAMLLDFFGLCSIMNPSTVDPYLEGDLKEIEIESIGASPRKMMQTLGTEWGRGLIDENLWLNSMRQRIEMYNEVEKHGHQGAFVFITDVRFDNEASMIKELGGEIVRVTSTRQDLDGVDSDHVTEKGVSDCLVDTTIENNGTPETFKDQSAAYLEGLLDAKLVDVAPIIIHIPPNEDEVSEED